MPLHLLGKKSWNVYNTANVERVRRDEAAATAAEEAAEERMQEADAARRLAIMRGETPPPLPEETEETTAAGALVKRDAWPTGEKKKRKRTGEDDTDFEMRVALERRAEGEAVAARLAQAGPPRSEEVPSEKSRRDTREVPGPTTFGAMKEVEKGWYVKPVRPGEDVETPGTDAFGREDPNRKVRDAVRLDKNDPLAMMKRGAAKVREIGKERKREAEEREKELRALRKEQRRSEKRRRRDGGKDEVDELEGFSLDAPVVEKERAEGERRRSRHRSHHEHERRQERDGRESKHGRDAEVRRRSSHRGEDERHRHSHRHHEREERVRAS